MTVASSANFVDCFLADVDAHEIAWPKPAGSPAPLSTHYVLSQGGGTDPLEVAVATAEAAPGADDVRRLWTSRWGTQNIPAILVAAYPDAVSGQWRASVCGTRPKPVVIPDVATSQLERILTTALSAPDSLQGERTFHRLLTAQKDQLIAGVTNQGLFATHELAHWVPERDDWQTSCQNGAPLLHKRGLELFAGLGYTPRSAGQ